jgi:hypothetical protein
VKKSFLHKIGGCYAVFAPALASIIDFWKEAILWQRLGQQSKGEARADRCTDTADSKWG